MRISLENIRLHAWHGVMEQERKVGGEYSVSLSVVCNDEKAVATDDVRDTINYADLFDIVRKEMAIPSNLLENVAGRIAQSVLSYSEKIAEVTVKVTKKTPPMGADCDGASVELTASRSR